MLITLGSWDLESNQVKRTPPDCISELIIGKLNSLVIPRIRLMGLMFKKINLILNFEMTSDFNIQIINSLLHS